MTLEQKINKIIDRYQLNELHTLNLSYKCVEEWDRTGEPWSIYVMYITNLSIKQKMAFLMIDELINQEPPETCQKSKSRYIRNLKEVFHRSEICLQEAWARRYNN